jgi:energy-coupling factor transporter ATP-binding protein EcfA2
MVMVARAMVKHPPLLILDEPTIELDTENTSIIHQADVEILTLDDNIVLPIGFDFPRMSIYQDRAAALKDPEMAMLAPAIQWLAGDTWEQKLAYADANPDAIGEALDLNRKVVHGISEQVKFECRRCRMEHVTKLELNALNFFRAGFLFNVFMITQVFSGNPG